MDHCPAEAAFCSPPAGRDGGEVSKGTRKKSDDICL